MPRRFDTERIAPCEARAADVLCRLIATGKSARNEDVAREMGVARDTAKHYLWDAMRKARFCNRVQFVMAWRSPIFQIGLQANGMRP